MTIPTTALFYTTKASNHTTDYVSPEHTVTNNSAVGVIASVSGVDTPTNMAEVDSLKVNTIDLFEDGKPTETVAEFFRLQGNQGTNEGKFTFTGAASAVTEEVNPSFKLVLSFAPNVEED